MSVNVKITTESKPFWKSKTFQIGLLTTIAGILTSIAGNAEAGIPLTAMSILMITMRAISTNAVTFFDEEQ